MSPIKVLLFLLIPIVGFTQSGSDTNTAKTSSKFKFKFIHTEEDSLLSTIYYLPLIGYNTTDGFMAGLHLTNSLLLDRRLKWSISPMFGFKTKEIIGFGDISYSFPLKRIFKKIDIGFKAKRFSYYHHELYEYNDNYLKLEPYLNILIKGEESKDAYQKIHLRWVQNYIKYGQGINIDSLFFTTKNIQSSVAEIQYDILSKNESGSLKGQANFQIGRNFSKINLIFKNSFAYENRRFVFIKIQAGYLFNSGSTDVNSYFTGTGRMGFFNRPNDYMFDNYFVDRNAREGFFYQQIFEKDAHIKTLANNILSGSYMISMGVKADLPIPGVPIQPYIDGVIYPDLFGEGTVFDYSLGIAISLLDENIEIYFPIYSSENIRNNINLSDRKYFQKVMFKIDLQNINFYKLNKKVKKLF